MSSPRRAATSAPSAAVTNTVVSRCSSGAKRESSTVCDTTNGTPNAGESMTAPMVSVSAPDEPTSVSSCPSDQSSSSIVVRCTATSPAASAPGNSPSTTSVRMLRPTAVGSMPVTANVESPTRTPAVANVSAARTPGSARTSATACSGTVPWAAPRRM